MKLLANGELLEKGGISKRLEDVSLQFRAKINVSFRSVCETDVDYVVANVSCLDDSRNHGLTPMKRQKGSGYFLIDGVPSRATVFFKE